MKIKTRITAIAAFLLALSLLLYPVFNVRTIHARSIMFCGATFVLGSVVIESIGKGWSNQTLFPGARAPAVYLLGFAALLYLSTAYVLNPELESRVSRLALACFIAATGADVLASRTDSGVKGDKTDKAESSSS